MVKPKISVIMPVYNTEKYVGEAIDSILNQSFVDFEFIIIDDCSRDKSYEICQKFAEKDKRIRLFQNKKNRGISFTRNKLINLSQTNYIATQDSDDISLRNRLELCIKFFENNDGYGAVSGNNIIIDENGKNIGIRKYSDDIGSVILKKSPLSNPSAMFKKNVFLEVGGYDKDLDYGEDYDLWCKMYLKGFLLKNLDVSLVKYRIRNDQTKTIKLKETIKNTIAIQKKYMALGIMPSLYDKGYIFLEKTLSYFPNKIIIFLFKKLEYRK